MLWLDHPAGLSCTSAGRFDKCIGNVVEIPTDLVYKFRGSLSICGDGCSGMISVTSKPWSMPVFYV